MKLNLRIPGPTPIPPQVQEALSRQMINHRGKEFAELLMRTTDKLKAIFQTESDLLIFPSAGTGMMEACIVNFFSPGDKVLIIAIGEFGNRFANIAKIYGLDVVLVTYPAGKAADADLLRITLQKESKIKGVFITHNETSTGVTNPLEELASIIKEETDALFIVDAESSLGSVNVLPDAWGIDVIFTASQKGFMCPPGLSMIAVNERGLKAYSQSSLPKYYFDVLSAKKYLEKGQTPYTPAVSLFFGIDKATDMMLEEGLEHIFKRHQDVADFTRSEVQRIGLSLFADPLYASNTVTSVYVPEGIDWKETSKVLEDDGLILGGGQGELNGKIFRIGHMGYVNKEDIKETIDILTKVI